MMISKIKNIPKKFLSALICLEPGQVGPQKCDFRDFVDLIINYIEQFIVVIFALSFFVLIWGIFKYVFLGQGDEKKITQAKGVIFYGIIGLFVMVSVWGIVKVLHTTLFGAN